METSDLINKIDNLENEINTIGISDPTISDKFEELNNLVLKTKENPEMLGGIKENAGKIINKFDKIYTSASESFTSGGFITEKGRTKLMEGVNHLKDLKNSILKPNENKVREYSKGPTPPSGISPNYDLSNARATNVQATGTNPIDINFKTDITNRTYGDIDLTSFNNSSFRKTSLILQRLEMNWNNLYDGSDPIMEGYVKWLTDELNYEAQRRVSFATEFTYKEMQNYLTVQSKSTNAYYSYWSFVQFVQDFHNRNDGMEFVRQNMSAEEFNLMDVFSMQVKGTPKPQNLSDFCYMLNANYRFEELPKSTIIKFTNADFDPGQARTLNFGIKGLLYGSSINDPACLTSDAFKATCRKLIRTIPAWDRSTMGMYDSNTYHSRNFNTLYLNTPNIVNIGNGNTGLYITPTTTEGKDIKYYSNTNDLDGLTTALSTIWTGNYPIVPDVSNMNKWVTGMFVPALFRPADGTNNPSSNRCAFDGEKFLDLTLWGVDFIGFTNGISSNANPLPHTQNVNTEEIYGLNTISLRQTNKELVKWMFDFGAVTAEPIKSMSSTNKRGSRGRSRKRKSNKQVKEE